LVLRTFIHSPAYRYLLATLYASTLRLTNDGALTYRLHDLKITLTPTSSLEFHPYHTSIRRGFCTITSLNWMPFVVGSRFPPRARNCLRIVHRYTRASWMLAIYLYDLALACNFETYRYFPLLTLMPFIFPVHIQSPLYLGLGHGLKKSSITTIASSPPHTSHLILFPPFFYLSRSTTQRESRLYLYIFLFRVSTPDMIHA